MPTQTYKIHGLRCVACAQKVEQILTLLPDVKNAEVSFTHSRIKILTSLTQDELNTALAPLGYTLELENIGSLAIYASDNITDKTETYIQNWETFSILWITLITLFIMGYETLSRYGIFTLTPFLQTAFAALLPILATTVLAMGGKPYFLGIWRFIRYGHGNMDTLVGIGTSIAYLYSLVLSFFPNRLGSHLHMGMAYYDVTIVVIGFVTFGKLLEERARSETNYSLRALLALQAKAARVQREGMEINIPIEEITTQDKILIKPGDKIPIDGLILSGTSFIDESMITGEALPILKTKGDTVTGGTINHDGSLILKPTAVGQASTLGRIIRSVQEAQNTRAPIQKYADRIAAIFVPMVLGIAALTFIGWLFIGPYFLPMTDAITQAILGCIGVLVIACPCALGLATPLALTVGIGKSAAAGIMIKNAEALEKLSHITDIIFDKTGTITEGKPKVRLFQSTQILRDHEVIALAASLEHASEHPLAKAIGDFAQLTSITLKEVSHFKAYKGCGVKGTIEGITYFIGSDSFIKDIAPIDQSLLERKETRILTPIILARYHQVLGYFFVGDVIKEGASQAIAALKNFGIKAHMATGDHSHAAAYVAQAVGIDSYPARMMPEDKQNLVYTLKARGAQVAVAGDGINDAPALAAADVGIAMSTGTDLAIETADLTLLHGDIRKIVKAYQLSRDTLKVIRQNLFWAFAFNGLGIPLAAGLFYPFGITLNPAFAGAAMAFSSLMVVGNAARFRFSP